MKTTTSNFKIKPLCENVFSHLLYWLWRLPQPGVAFTLAWTKKLRLLIALAYKDLHAGLVALMMAVTANRRIYFGLVIMFVCAPLAYCWYAMFDRAHHIPGWYHVNYFHLFFLIRVQLGISVFLLGLYFFLPADKRTKLLSIPLGYFLMSIAANVMASSNEDIWRIGSVSLFAAGVCISLVLFFGLDYFTHRQFHRADAFEKRLEGIFQIADELPADKVKSMFVTTWRERKEFKAKG